MGVVILCLDSIVSQLRLLWAKGVYMFRCNLPPGLFCRMIGILWRHGDGKDMERVSTQSELWRRFLFKPLLPGINWTPDLLTRARRSTTDLYQDTIWRGVPGVQPPPPSLPFFRRKGEGIVVDSLPLFTTGSFPPFFLYAKHVCITT